MTCDLLNMLKNAGAMCRHKPGGYEFALNELGHNLWELRDRCKAGDFKAVDEFFAIYTIPETVVTQGEQS